jgi:hypothetical protein
MTETKPPETKSDPKPATQGAPALGPKTGIPQPEWRKDRDYAKFNPTPEK